ncbi:MAG: hypothetical protein LM517_11660 [Nitrosomonas sp.]|nr:hypothetical protein [Nitrosomonas sp.]
MTRRDPVRCISTRLKTTPLSLIQQACPDHVLERKADLLVMAASDTL